MSTNQILKSPSWGQSAYNPEDLATQLLAVAASTNPMEGKRPFFNGRWGVEGGYFATHVDYLGDLFNRPELIVDRFKLTMINASIDFDTVIGRGISGALCAQLIGRETGKQWAVVRKPDNSHSDREVEGTVGKRWVFVDDLISTGATLRETIAALERFKLASRWPTQLVGTYLYLPDVFYPGASENEINSSRNRW
jgi:hypothetical protein